MAPTWPSRWRGRARRLGAGPLRTARRGGCGRRLRARASSGPRCAGSGRRSRSSRRSGRRRACARQPRPRTRGRRAAGRGSGRATRRRPRRPGSRAVRARTPGSGRSVTGRMGRLTRRGEASSGRDVRERRGAPLAELAKAAPNIHNVSMRRRRRLALMKPTPLPWLRPVRSEVRPSPHRKTFVTADNGTVQESIDSDPSVRPWPASHGEWLGRPGRRVGRAGDGSRGIGATLRPCPRGSPTPAGTAPRSASSSTPTASWRRSPTTCSTTAT